VQTCALPIEWWYWAVGGILLILLELAIPAFFVIWFGLGALLVAGVMLVVGDASLTTQLALWGVASLAMVALWFQVFNPKRHKTLVGTAAGEVRSEEHTSELQSRENLVCRLLLEKKKTQKTRCSLQID